MEDDTLSEFIVTTTFHQFKKECNLIKPVKSKSLPENCTLTLQQLAIAHRVITFKKNYRQCLVNTNIENVSGRNFSTEGRFFFWGEWSMKDVNNYNGLSREVACCMFFMKCK